MFFFSFIALDRMTTLGPLTPQEPEWLWQCLWTALGDEARPGDSFILNIPDTVLLDAQGMPERWLGVARSGAVVRKRFPSNKTGRKVRASAAVRAYDAFAQYGATAVRVPCRWRCPWPARGGSGRSS